MTTPELHHEPDNPENTFLRDNSRKKTYTEAIQDANMQGSTIWSGRRRQGRTIKPGRGHGKADITR